MLVCCALCVLRWGSYSRKFMSREELEAVRAKRCSKKGKDKGPKAAGASTEEGEGKGGGGSALARAAAGAAYEDSAEGALASGSGGGGASSPAAARRGFVTVRVREHTGPEGELVWVERRVPKPAE